MTRSGGQSLSATSAPTGRSPGPWSQSWGPPRSRRCSLCSDTLMLTPLLLEVSLKSVWSKRSTKVQPEFKVLKSAGYNSSQPKSLEGLRLMLRYKAQVALRVLDVSQQKQFNFQGLSIFFLLISSFQYKKSWARLTNFRLYWHYQQRATVSYRWPF